MKKTYEDIKNEIKADTFVKIDSGLASHIKNNLQPLYDLLTAFQNEINKASVIEEIGLDPSGSIAKLISDIDREKESITKINYYIEMRVRNIFETDKRMSELIKKYRESLSKEEYNSIVNASKKDNVNPNQVLKNKVLDDIVDEVKSDVENKYYIDE